MLTTIFLIAVILFLFTGKTDFLEAGCLYLLLKMVFPILLVIALILLL